MTRQNFLARIIRMFKKLLFGLKMEDVDSSEMKRELEERHRSIDQLSRQYEDNLRSLDAWMEKGRAAENKNEKRHIALRIRGFQGDLRTLDNMLALQEKEILTQQSLLGVKELDDFRGKIVKVKSLRGVSQTRLEQYLEEVSSRWEEANDMADGMKEGVDTAWSRIDGITAAPSAARSELDAIVADLREPAGNGGKNAREERIEDSIGESLLRNQD